MRISHLYIVVCGFCGLLLSFTPAAHAASATADRIMRYVNNEVITQGDVWDEMRRRYVTLRHRGQELPNDRDSLERFQRETLEELTDSMLIEQEAKRLGIQLDEIALRRQVREWIRDNNLPPSLDHQAQEQRRRLREAYIHTVLRHYQARWPTISPAHIRSAYESNPERFRQQPRVHTARILLRRSVPDDQRRLLRTMMEVLQQVQVDPLPEVVAAADDERLSQIVRSSEAERPALIAEVLQQAQAAIPDDAPAQSQRLAERIEQTLKQWRNQQDDGAVLERLESVRQELLAIDDPDQRRQAFQERAKAISQGPRASDGGDMGWFERGSEDSQLEELAFSIPIGSVSEAFSSGAFSGILMVFDREDRTVRDLRQVAPEIRAQLERQRNDEIRRTLVRQLRNRGVVRDIEQAAVLPQEWFGDGDVLFSE